MPYEMVPRALRSLGAAIERGTGRIAQAKQAEARLGLEESRVGFEVRKAEEVRAERELTKPVRQLASVTAREELEARGKPVRFGDLFRGLDAEDIPHFMTELKPLYEAEGFEFTETPTGLNVLRHGKQYTGSQMKRDAELLSNLYLYGSDLTKKFGKDKDDENILMQQRDLLHQRRPYPGASQVTIDAWKSRVKYVEGRLKAVQEAKTKKEVARIKATGKIPTVGGVKIGTKEERKEGDKIVTYRMTKKGWKEIARGPRKVKKPKEKKEPTAANFTSVIKLIERVTQKGEREPTADNVAMIDEAARAIGYEYTKIKGPIRPEEKRWWWFDPETKERWTLRKTKPGAGKPGEKYRGKINKEEMREIDEAGKKVPWEKPGSKKVHRTGIINGRKVIQYEDGHIAYAD